MKTENKKFKVGDKVRATKDCGLTKKGRIYKVRLCKKNYLGGLMEPYLAINPRNGLNNTYTNCTEIKTWELVKE
uniref:Uncharacterized protein n=1 Tax=viral metagenome TaxID=1070528 RepID=A0A6M3JJT8_9ZZZZ